MDVLSCGAPKAAEDFIGRWQGREGGQEQSNYAWS